MEDKSFRLIAVVAALLAFCSPLFAHHGNASINTDKALILKGATVTRFVWANPHCIVVFDAADDKGNVQQ